MNNTFKAVSSDQENFLNTNVDFALYGGGSGAGKTTCLLGSFLNVHSNPSTRGIILRSNIKQITGEGGLFDTAVKMFKQVDTELKVLMNTLEIIFSSGSVLKFSGIKDQDGGYNWIGFDELQEFNYDEYKGLVEQLGTESFPLSIRATCTSDYSSWVKQLVQSNLDSKGVPLLANRTNPEVKYIVNTPDCVTVFETEAQSSLVDADCRHMSFMFQPADIYSNTELMKNEPSYVETLKALPKYNMERLLLGSWNSPK